MLVLTLLLFRKLQGHTVSVESILVRFDEDSTMQGVWYKQDKRHGSMDFALTSCREEYRDNERNRGAMKLHRPLLRVESIQV